jgi:hypothetical protein
MFPWLSENSAPNVQPREDAGLKQQVEESRLKKQQEKHNRIQAGKADDLRIEQERAAFAAEAQREIQAQRDRESLVAQREAQAQARFQQAGELSREQKIHEFQMRREGMLDSGSGQQAPGQQVAGTRMRVQTEHTGISDHPSTKVHAPPGGASSFAFSYGDVQPAQRQEKAPPPPQAAPQAMVQQQAPGQQVAGTRMRVQTEHTGISEHPSTKVHAPPGGASSFSFGHEDVQPTQRREKAPPAQVMAPVAAPVAGGLRSDQETDAIAALNRRRAQGSSIFG